MSKISNPRARATVKCFYRPAKSASYGKLSPKRVQRIKTAEGPCHPRHLRWHQKTGESAHGRHHSTFSRFQSRKEPVSSMERESTISKCFLTASSTGNTSYFALACKNLRVRSVSTVP